MVEFGLIGWPLGHSFSAKYFEQKFKREGFEGKYSLHPLPDLYKLPELIEGQPNLLGLNVTIPYKEKVIDYLDELSDDAAQIGAVNVIKIENGPNGKILKGYNSDCQAFQETLSPLVEEGIDSALILGTGGAAKAVRRALDNLGIESTFVSRNPCVSQNIITYGDLDRTVIERNRLIVNATPLGMSPDSATFPDIPYSFLGANHICYDLVYNPEITEFIKRSSKQGAKTNNGLEMLYRQADIAFEIWSGTRES